MRKLTTNENNELNLIRQALENASGLNVEIPREVQSLDDIQLRGWDVYKLVVGTQYMTKTAVQKLETAQKTVIEGVRGITGPAFCTNGPETRTTIRTATHELGKILAAFRSDVSETLIEYTFIEANDSAIQMILDYIIGLKNHSERYFQINPVSERSDYRTRLRESHEALDRLRDYITEHDWRFVELLDKLSGIPRDIEAKRYIRDVAKRVKEVPKRGEYADVGLVVYHKLSRLRKASRKQRRAREMMRVYFFDTGSIADRRGLGIFMSQAYQLSE